MLGSALAKVLISDGFRVIEFNRSGTTRNFGEIAYRCDVENEMSYIFRDLQQIKPDYIVNAIGVIRQKMNEADPGTYLSAQKVNVDFPNRLNDFQAQTGIPIIQIGTDCVFSGQRGGYSEIEKFDPVDFYGQTKVEGEKKSSLAMTIRTSIVGREHSSNFSLLSWVLSTPPNSNIDGYKNHKWNGVTTLAFSKIVSGVLRENIFKSGVVHLVPGDSLSKYELLKEIKSAFGREDLQINKFSTGRAVDMTLSTTDTELNRRLWRAGRYNDIPTIKELLLEYANWSNRIENFNQS
jgi:dTDP-4-dehydrorhamnose reductase